MAGEQYSRRTVIKGAVAASVGLPYYIPGGVLAAPGHPGANDRIVYGHLGVGGMAAIMWRPTPAQQSATSIRTIWQR
jgi:hypothetical protein